MGSTTLVIEGFDLGVSVNEIEVRIGDLICEILTSRYLPGKYQYVGFCQHVATYQALHAHCLHVPYISQCSLPLHAAQQIVCKTPASAMTGFFNITVTVDRNPSSSSAHTLFTAEFAAGVDSQFQFIDPVLHDIAPSYGPWSGGTLLVLTGSALSISNTTLTSITLAGHHCSIQ